MPGNGHRGGGRAGNRHHRADRQVNPAGSDNQRHANRQQRDRRRAVKNIDGATEQAPLLEDNLEKVRRHQAINGQHQQQRNNLRHTLRPAEATLRLAGLRKRSWHHDLLLCRNCVHDRRNGELPERDLRHLFAIAHDNDPIGIAHQLFQL